MSEKYVNKENLERFWDNAKEYIGNEKKEIEDQLYNWQKTEKAPVVQCEPVPNSELHSVVEFKFKETLPEGEKGPENPSIINGINNIKVIRSTENIITIPDYRVVNINIPFTDNNDGSFTLNGSISETSGNFIYRQSLGTYEQQMNLINAAYATFLPEGTYKIGILLENGSYNQSDKKPYLRLRTVKTLGGPLILQDLAAWTVSNINDGYTLVVPSGGIWYSFVIYLYGESSYTDCKLRPFLCKEPTINNNKELLLNNTQYLINLNDTYYGGSVDLSTGLMTIDKIATIITNSTTFNYLNTNTNTFEVVVTLDIPFVPTLVVNKCTCDHFAVNSTVDDTEHIRVYSGDALAYKQVRLYIPQSLLNLDSTAASSDIIAATKTWFSNNPTTLVLGLASTSQYTVQLTPQQIKSLSSLEGTSKRINTIYTDADSVQVEYQKYVGIDSILDSDSVNAIQNKTVNSALNTKVSLSGDETISGTKTFSNTINGNITGDAGTVAGHIVSKDVPVNATFTDTTYEPATQSTAGLMSASDKTKLDAIGSVFSFKGSVVNSSSLPVSNNTNGDAYLAEDTGHVHVYDGSSFVDIGVWAGIPSATDAQIDALFED